MNVTRMKHPEMSPPLPTPPLVRVKTVFHKIGPWCQKIGDL